MVDVSVIVPIYGVEAFIEASLRSLFSQSKSEGVEYILVNDATPDSSIIIARELIAHYPHLNIKIIDKSQNEGVAAARQTGLEAASGEYILNFDPDDFCEPDMIAQMYEHAINNSADIVVCDFFVKSPKGEVYVKQAIPNTTNAAIKALLKGELHGALWNKLFKRTLFTNGNISFIKGINFMEDMLICLKLFLNAKQIAYLPNGYLHYVQNDSSIVAQFSQKKLDNAIDMCNEVENYFIQNNVADEYANELIQRKAITKLFVLRYCAKRQQRNYIKLYGKLNNNNVLPSKLRMALRCAENGNIWIYNLTNSIHNTLKKLK